LERTYMKDAQAARAKAGHERLAKVRCRSKSVNMGLKIPCSAALKLEMLPAESGGLPGPPPVTM
jgi:hypothetical protein